SQRRTPATTTLGDAVVTFRPVGLGVIGDVVLLAERVAFRLRIGGRPLTLQMASGLYERLLARIDPELLAAEIDPDILPLLLESCIEDGLCAAEASLQRRVELVAVEQGAAVDLEGLEVALEISIDGEKAGLATLHAARAEVERLADLFAARPKPSRSYRDLEVELRFRAGAVWLDLGALKTLKSGDVLLVEEDAPRWERMAATMGEQWLFPIEVTRAGPTVGAPLRKADPRDQEEWMMTEHDHRDDDEEALNGLLKATPQRSAEPQDGAEQQGTGPQQDTDRNRALDDGHPDPERHSAAEWPAAAERPDTAFDDLPIKLVFELGRLEMPLGKLQEIGPGHVFQLDRPLGEAVEINAGNRRIGQGEVIRIEDQIGVRIVSLFGQSRA
ncbi:MAG: type III secretion system cytoplasmic ring protein SctQ, partial [Geminicoccaceae bacterium]